MSQFYLSTTRPVFIPNNNWATSLHFSNFIIFLNEWVSEVAQSCPTLCDPIDYSLPGSSVHGIFQARVLEWVAISFSIFLNGGKLIIWYGASPSAFSAIYSFLPLLGLLTWSLQNCLSLLSLRIWTPIFLSLNIWWHPCLFLPHPVSCKSLPHWSLYLTAHSLFKPLQSRM